MITIEVSSPFRPRIIRHVHESCDFIFSFLRKNAQNVNGMGRTENTERFILVIHMDERLKRKHLCCTAAVAA